MTKTITSADLRKELESDLSGCENPQINLADKEYKPLTTKQLLKIEKWMKLIRLFFHYKKEVRDCDDFTKVANAVAAIVAPGSAFGSVWAYNLHPSGEYHSLNVFYDEFDTLHTYEPQNGKTKRLFAAIGKNAKVTI